MASTRRVLDAVETWEQQRKAVLAAIEAGRLARSKALAFANPPPHDPWRLLSRRYSRKQRQTTARYVAARMSTRFKDPAVKAALRERGSGTDRWLREVVFPQALLLAAQERYTAQRVRLGKDWVGGRQRPVVPMSLAWPNAVRWLKQRARRLAAEQILHSALYVRHSRKEVELLRHLRAQVPFAAIAEHMDISPSTLRTMRSRLQAKFRKRGKVQ